MTIASVDMREGGATWPRKTLGPPKRLPLTLALVSGMIAASASAFIDAASLFVWLAGQIAILSFYTCWQRQCRRTGPASLAAAGLAVEMAQKDALIAALEKANSACELARRRAEEANIAKSRFLATMSHELRTPMNAILGFSEVMKSELFGAHLVDCYREYSADIHSSGQHLLMLINEILDLSRIEAGRFELKEEPVFLSDVVEECRHLLALRARAREIEIVEVIETDLVPVLADLRAMRQITLNLLSNAIKFTHAGGQVKIKLGWTKMGGQYLSLRDNGPGIPEDEIPVVMCSFGRGKRAETIGEEGTGLGLSIVNGLVELHGGQFTLRSQLGEGTEVIVILPPERVVEGPGAADAPEAREPRMALNAGAGA